MSIESEINRINTNVQNTLAAIEEMGGEVPEDGNSDDMAGGVKTIPIGAKIDDTKPSASTTYSSEKIEAELSKQNEAKANNADLAAVAKSGSYNDLVNKPTIPTVPSALPNPNSLTFTGAVNETYDGSTAKSVAIPTVPESLKNPKKLTFTGAVTAEYDGSAPVSVEIPAGGGPAYELPIASPTTIGGVMPAAKTDDMTQAVGVDGEGRLWTQPGGGGGGWTLHATQTTTEEGVTSIKFEDIGDLGTEYLVVVTGKGDGTNGVTVNIRYNSTGWVFLDNQFMLPAAVDRYFEAYILNNGIDGRRMAEYTELHTSPGTTGNLRRKVLSMPGGATSGGKIDWLEVYSRSPTTQTFGVGFEVSLYYR